MEFHSSFYLISISSTTTLRKLKKEMKMQKQTRNLSSIRMIRGGREVVVGRLSQWEGLLLLEAGGRHTSAGWCALTDTRIFLGLGSLSGPRDCGSHMCPFISVPKTFILIHSLIISIEVLSITSASNRGPKGLPPCCSCPG